MSRFSKAMVTMRQINDIPVPPLRAADAHKGTFGKVLIIGGAVGMSGAPGLAGRAALRSGSGLVRIAIPRCIQPIVAGYEMCYTTIGLDDEQGGLSAGALNQILSQINDNDAVAFGPGVGLLSGVQACLLGLLSQRGLKLVVDADGLNILAKCGGVGGWCDQTAAQLVLTPHPGEMKRLWQSLFREPMPDDRIVQAVQLAQRTNTIVVLKGSGTVVTDGRNYYINQTGNPGMATAGAGDVLTGVITSLIGQGLTLFDAAVLGVFSHGLAGDIMAHKKGPVGLMATDIIEGLCDAFQ